MLRNFDDGENNEFLNDLGGLGNDELLEIPMAGLPADSTGDESGGDTVSLYTDGLEDMPRFSLGQVDDFNDEFTDEDSDTMERLSLWLECPACNDPNTICQKEFEHYYKVGMARIFYLCHTIATMISGSRAALNHMGADTRGDLDLSILSSIGELNHIKTLMPKLLAAQEELDSDAQ
jgi:hypothetical protein